MSHSRAREQLDELLRSLGEDPFAEPAARAPDKPKARRNTRSSPSPSAPPPLPKQARRRYEGRVEFEDLFVQDTAPLPAVQGPDQKIEYFREKLRRAEAQVARLREAWQVRTHDLDSVEALLASERQRGDEAVAAVRQLQAFVEQKRQEFEAYGKKVSKAFADREALDKGLRAELQRARAEVERVEAELAAASEKLERAQEQRPRRQTSGGRQAREELEREVASRDETLNKLKATLVAQRDAIRERDARIGELEGELGGVTRVAIISPVLDELSQRCDELAAELDKARHESSRVKRGARSHLERVRKALGVAALLLSDLLGSDLVGADDELGDIVARLQKTLDIARQEVDGP